MHLIKLLNARTACMAAFHVSGATTHVPLAAIENLTPVKTVIDDVLPTKLPKIKTFDAASRYITASKIKLLVTLHHKRSPYGCMHWAQQRQQHQQASPWGLASPAVTLQKAPCTPACISLKVSVYRAVFWLYKQPPAAFSMPLHMSKRCTRCPPHPPDPAGSAAPAPPLPTAPCPLPRACPATTRRSSTPPATQDGWSPRGGVRHGPRPSPGRPC